MRLQTVQLWVALFHQSPEGGALFRRVHLLVPKRSLSFFLFSIYRQRLKMYICNAKYFIGDIGEAHTRIRNKIE